MTEIPEQSHNRETQPAAGRPSGNGYNRRRGFGVAAGLDTSVARELGLRCANLGYTSLWSNDHPGASGLETLAALGRDAPNLDLGIGALPLDRHQPDEVASQIDALGIEPSRLWLAFGAGFSKEPLNTVRSGVEQMRAALPAGVKLLIAAMGPKMCSLAGEIADGVMLNWMTPERARWAREQVAAGANAGGRPLPPVVAYVRVSVDERATDRLLKEESFYRDLHDGYRRHFAALGTELGTVGVATPDPVEVAAELRAYEESLDEIVVRALASASVESMGAVAQAAAARP